MRIGNRGVAAAEFALVAPVLVLLLLGTFDVATLMQTSIRLERAARSGAQFAMANSTDMAAIQSRVIAAWPTLTTADVPLPVSACECAGVTVLCTASCQSGLVQTVTITARRTLVPHVLQTLTQARGHAVVRVR